MSDARNSSARSPGLSFLSVLLLSARTVMRTFALLCERALRKAKNRQKMAGGFRKGSGHEMYCAIMSIIETLKKRKMDTIENVKKLFMGTPAIF